MVYIAIGYLKCDWALGFKKQKGAIDPSPLTVTKAKQNLKIRSLICAEHILHR